MKKEKKNLLTKSAAAGMLQPYVVETPAIANFEMDLFIFYYLCGFFGGFY